MNRSSRILRLALLSIGLLETLVVLFHVLGVQETPNWRWPWRNGRAWPLYPAMALAALPLVVGLWLHSRRRHGRIALLCIALSAIAFQLSGQIAATTPPDWRRPIAIIQDRVCTSYWSDAAKLAARGESIRSVLANYPALMPGLYQHSQEKPPGPVLFYLLLMRWLGTSGASAAGAGLIALLTAAGVPAVFVLSRTMLHDDESGFWAAALYAVVPSVVALYPMFDSCYPAVVCAMAVATVAAMRTDRWWWGVILGLLLTGISLFVYNLLVMGTFLLGLMAIETFCRDIVRWTSAARAALLAGVTVLAAYAVLWFISGFDPVATFRAAIRIQNHVNVVARRPYPRTIVFDFFDFVFGTGRMLALLGVLGVVGERVNPEGSVAGCRTRWFLWLCFAQILIVGCTGLLRGETARVWCFLVPLVTIPAGRALAAWPPRWRYAALLIQGLLMLAMVQNVEFNSLSLP